MATRKTNGPVSARALKRYEALIAGTPFRDPATGKVEIQTAYGTSPLQKRAYPEYQKLAEQGPYKKPKKP